MDVKARLGKRVSALRDAKGHTQQELAQRCGYTQKFISEIERGRVNVPLETLAAVARGLSVSMSELLVGVDASVPREVRRLEELIAGYGSRVQGAIVRLLTAVNDLVTAVRSDKKDDLEKPTDA